MNRWGLPLAALAGAVLGAGAIWGVDRSQGGPAGPAIRSYLLAHPEVVEEAVVGMQRMQVGRVVAQHRDAIETPYAGAWAGDPKGDVTLVEYFDYNCGYCRASLPALAQLLHDDPHVRLVYRELPVLAESSRDAARASLAAAAQGRYAAFHTALYDAGPVSAASIAVAARAAKVDTARVPPDADSEFERNRETYLAIGGGGTPTWVIGDRVVSGVQSLDALKALVVAARGGSESDAALRP